MPTDRYKDCKCFQHQFLNCLEKGLNEEAQSILQDRKNFSEWTDSSKLTLLHYSAKCGNAEMTQYLIDQGCDVNAQDNSGHTPLTLAVKAKDLRTCEVLLQNEADVYVTNSDGKNSLQLAFYSVFDFHHFVTQPSRIILQMLFDRVNTDFLEGKLNNFLLNANDEMKFVLAARGSAEVTKFTLANGYPIDFRESTRGHTALHAAVVLPRLENVKILVEHGADVDLPDEQDRSPLRDYTGRFESLDEDSEVLKMLLRSSRQLSRPDKCSFTDVEDLLLCGKERTVRTVLLSGVDVDSCIAGNRSILYLLVCNSKISDLDFLTELDVKLNVDERNVDLKPALTLAIYCGYLKKIEFLLQRQGVDVNATASTRISALSISLDCRHSETKTNAVKVVEVLLRHGADVQSFLKVRPERLRVFNARAKVIVAHLAMLEATEKASLTDSSRSKIESDPRWKAHFDLCARQLDELKTAEVHGAVTLFKLLTESEEKIVGYARNEELLEKFNGAIENLTGLEAYYVDSLRGRLSRGAEIAKLEEKAALTIGVLTGLCTDVYHAIVYKIIGYLDHQDLRKLCKIEETLRLGDT